MTQSADYKRGYGKGYATGRGDRSKEEMRHREEMQQVAIRAERAEAAAGIGHCIDCAHWDRPSPEYSWGHCRANDRLHRQPGTPFGCWAQQGDTGGLPATTQYFGCVLFVPKEGNDRG